MTTVLLTVTSITSMVLHNCVSNGMCKKELKTTDRMIFFNFLGYIVCILLFGICAISDGISLFTVGMGALFGIVTALNNFYKLSALSEGPMHLTLLITTSSMIIPTMSGVFFGEHFYAKKLIAVAFLIGFIYLSLGKSGDKKINKKWIVYCLLTFIFTGTVGVLQKIHQTSVHKGEVNSFLLVAFVFSLAYSRMRIKSKLCELKIGRKNIFFALICGLCIYTMNIINLKLSGMLPSQLFFPLVNGSSIVLSSVFSVVIFKEKITLLQTVGLIGGIASLIAICILK